MSLGCLWIIFKENAKNDFFFVSMILFKRRRKMRNWNVDRKTILCLLRSSFKAWRSRFASAELYVAVLIFTTVSLWFVLVQSNFKSYHCNFKQIFDWKQIFKRLWSMWSTFMEVSCYLSWYPCLALMNHLDPSCVLNTFPVRSEAKFTRLFSRAAVCS